MFDYYMLQNLKSYSYHIPIICKMIISVFYSIILIHSTNHTKPLMHYAYMNTCFHPMSIKIKFVSQNPKLGFTSYYHQPIILLHYVLVILLVSKNQC